MTIRVGQWRSGQWLKYGDGGALGRTMLWLFIGYLAS